MTATAMAPTSARPPIPLSLIDESPFNPRKEFTGIEDLAASIKAQGLLEGLLLRPGRKTGRFELVFGARRLRALKLNKTADVTNYDVRDLTDADAKAAQIVENLQRENVGTLEEAEGFAQLQAEDPKKWTALEIAKAVGKTDRFVQQRLAIARNLAPEMKKKLAADQITVETARTLAGFPAAVQRELPNWALDRDADTVRRQLFERCIPQSAAKFDVALYKGDWLENGNRKFFADTAQFMKLQRAAAEKKLAEVQMDWPGAVIVPTERAGNFYWPDATTHWSIDNANSSREGDKPRGFKVPKEKCMAIVWIAGNGEIRKALGVCDKDKIEAAITAAERKRARSSGGGSRSVSQTPEKADHRKARIAFNAAVTAAGRRTAGFVERLTLYRILADDFSIAGSRQATEKATPPALRKLARSASYRAESRAPLWAAIAKMTVAQVDKALTDLLLTDLPLWEAYEWRNKPVELITMAGSLGVKVPAIALPEPPKPTPDQRAADTMKAAVAAGLLPGKAPAKKKVALKKATAKTKAKTKAKAKAKKHA